MLTWRVEGTAAVGQLRQAAGVAAGPRTHRRSHTEGWSHWRWADGPAAVALPSAKSSYSGGGVPGALATSCCCRLLRTVNVTKQRCLQTWCMLTVGTCQLMVDSVLSHGADLGERSRGVGGAAGGQGSSRPGGLGGQRGREAADGLPARTAGGAAGGTQRSGAAGDRGGAPVAALAAARRQALEHGRALRAPDSLVHQALATTNQLAVADTTFTPAWQPWAGRGGSGAGGSPGPAAMCPSSCWKCWDTSSGCRLLSASWLLLLRYLRKKACVPPAAAAAGGCGRSLWQPAPAVCCLRRLACRASGVWDAGMPYCACRWRGKVRVCRVCRPPRGCCGLSPARSMAASVSCTKAVRSSSSTVPAASAAASRAASCCSSARSSLAAAATCSAVPGWNCRGCGGAPGPGVVSGRGSGWVAA